jgi:membrane-associated phospholipid phosphatase
VLELASDFGWWPIACGVQVTACAVTAWHQRDRAAWAGLIALCAAAAAVVVLRLAVWHNAELFGAVGLVKPSGHSALAAVVYGTIGFVLGRHLPPWRRGAVRVACLAVMAMVPAAMVGLGFHTVPDVLVGGAAGLAALALGHALTLAWARPALATSVGGDGAVRGRAGRIYVVERREGRGAGQHVLDVLLDPEVDLRDVRARHDHGV